MLLGPFDLTGGPFLQLYAVLLVFTILAGFFIPHWLRPEGRMPRNTHIDELAFLAGGGPRLAEAVTARLLATRQLVIDGNNFLAGDLDSGTPAERSVLALPQPADWGAVAHAVGQHADSVRERLVENELLMDGWTGLQLRFWQTSPYFLLLAFGWIKLQIGEARGRPVGYLTMLLMVTAFLAIVRLAALDRRTRAGRAVLRETQARSERLRRAPASGETDLAVALFGTVVLVGSAWGDFHKLRASSSSSSSSSNSGADSGTGDGGGGGCGGGGCGGCGS